jgi:hypothetical protein
MAEYLDRSRQGWNVDGPSHDVTVRCLRQQCRRETLRVELYSERFDCNQCGARGTGSVELCRFDQDITSVQAAKHLGCYIEPEDREVWP